MAGLVPSNVADALTCRFFNRILDELDVERGPRALSMMQQGGLPGLQGAHARAFDDDDFLVSTGHKMDLVTFPH
ncbi:hypothetical protein D3C81_2158580 [compost metagenome]